MKGDISADFHVPAKRYSGVRAQAGRVLTDADFNAAFDVLDDRLEILVRTLLCAAGSPDGGLQPLAAAPATVAVPGGGNVQTYTVDLAPGTFVLGGRATLVRNPIDSLDQWDWLSQYLTPAVLPPAPQAGRTDLVYLEQVEQPVHMVEDRELHERALGSADTTTRLRPQLRIRILDDVPPDCTLAAQTLVQTLAQGGHQLSDDRTELLSAARLGVAFVDDGPSLDPCAPASAAGYLGAENHCLRVMLTAPGRFVWAYDHGTPLYRVEIDAANGEVHFLTEPRDPELYPLPNQIIEILPWDALLPNGEKAAAPLGHLARLTGHYDPASRRMAYDGSMPAAWQTWLNGLPASLLGRDDDPPRFFYARIWQRPVSGAGPDQVTGTNIILPETGIALHFAGNGLPGDYWTVALRPNAPQLVQPWNLMIDPAAGEVPVAPPIGPRRFHAPLGLVTWPTPLGAAPQGEIHDCRNRFRRLCRIKGCCTWQVGDGQSSFGDFNSIQDAVDALPAEGGEICLLPGIHLGPIDLRNRRDIKVSGCGGRTRIEIDADPANPGRPGVRLDGSRNISFSDFTISARAAPAFGARTLSQETRIERVRILTRESAAVALARADGAVIADCRIRAEALAEALTSANLAGLLPLVYLAGRDLDVERNEITADFLQLNRNRVALGGIQIGGRSSNVRIVDNRIEGGNGHGITLGSIVSDETRPTGDIVIVFPPWIIVDEDGCVKFVPGGTVTLPGGNQASRPRSAGPVRRLRISGNHIADHGGCGITVAHWFIAGAKDGVDDLDDIEVEEAKIDDNRIYRCMRIDLSSALSVDAAFASGYGGIALAATSDLLIDDNEIRFCGGTGRSPICGIYIRFAERLRITSNRISENGRPASLTDPLLIGNIGGIVIGHADGVEADAATAVREVPAAVITDNHVVSPEGRALELLGTGAMMVDNNSFTSHGNNLGGIILQLLVGFLAAGNSVGGPLTEAQTQSQLRAVLAQIGGSAVLILNTGRNRNFADYGVAAATLGGGKAETAPAATGTAPAPPGGVSDGPADIQNEKAPKNMDQSSLSLRSSSRAEWRRQSYFNANGLVAPGRARTQPGGAVAFSDNMVAFDARSNAITISLCSVAIISFDDVGMHDNICTVDLEQDFVMVNAVVLGFASCRVIGNRFRETLTVSDDNDDDNSFTPTFLSAATFGLLNATELNQGDYCFLTLGWKKPRVIVNIPGAVVDARLDTNRHTIPEGNCDRFFEMSRSER